MTNEPSGFKSRSLSQWVADMARLTGAARIVWCDGSEEEKYRLTREAITQKILIPLNPVKRPGCYLHRSNPNDVARSEHLTFVCTPTREDAGPTNNWMPPGDAYTKLGALLKGSMTRRTMYVVPYIMGPPGSPFAKVGVELTDSVYVVLNMRIMTRMGRVALDLLGESHDFNKGLHSTLDCNPQRRFICHFPQDNTVWSVGSGYGGNALLSKKCFALRIGSYLGCKEGWLAEHMLILGLESPAGETTYVGAAFPSACGKTNLAMLMPPASFKGWRVFTVGDDIAWLRIGPDGGLWAVNPESGYFGVAPGTSARSNPNAMKTIERDTIFTNVALTPDGDVWWEGMDREPPEGTLDWRGLPWKPDSGEPAAHPNSRFTAPMNNNPALSPRAAHPLGVPISAIIFGGRRASTIPLLLEAYDWDHGVFLGASMGSETTAAATGQIGVVRRDPMAMLPFCGYNIVNYFGHWHDMGRKMKHPPKIFVVNWFRKDRNGSYLWPGYSENMRALKWIADRANGRVGAEDTALGLVPREADIDVSGLDISLEELRQASSIDAGEWLAELDCIEEYFTQLGVSSLTGFDVQIESARAGLERAR